MKPIIQKILINFGLDIGKLFVKKAGEKISEKVSKPKEDKQPLQEDDRQRR